MGTITAQTLVDRAEKIIQDETNVRWTSTELLGWLNDGQREIVIHRPDAYTKSIPHTLTVSETKQTIPTDGNRVIDVVRNLGGTKPAIRQIKREILDDQIPDWHSAGANAIVQHFCYDDRDPTRFYVYPVQPASSPGSVELVYSAAPPDVAIGAAILIPDTLSNALIDYILYRAYQKDVEYAGNDKRKEEAWLAFSRSLASNVQANAAFSATGKEVR